MSLLVANAGRAALAALVLFTALTLRREAQTRERAAVLAVEAEDVSALCRRTGRREGLFLERLKHLGVSGVVVRPEPVERLVEGRAVTRFSASELERLRAAGLAAPDAPLSPGALFVQSDAVRRRLEAAALAQDLALKQGRWGKVSVLELPPGASESMSAGFDPAAAARAADAGLSPVYAVSTTADLRLAVDAEGAGAVLLERPASAFDAAARGALEDALAERRLWAALPAGSSAGGLARGTGRLLAAGAARPGVPLGELLSVVEGQGTALVVLRLDPALSPEAAAAELRRLARGVRARGVGTAWPVGQDDRPAPSRGENAARALLALAAVVLGSVWGMRRAVSAARAVSKAPWLAEASPLREAGAGLLAAFLVCSLAGAVSHAALVDAGPGLPPWSAAAAVLVAALGFAGLWLDEDAALSRPLLIKGAAAGLLVWLLCAPPAALAGSGWGLSALAALRPEWWWLPARWQEVLVGWPALVYGLCLYADSDADARPWLFAGLAGPAGAALALSRARVPYLALLEQTAQAAALGALLGAGLWALRNCRSRDA